MDREHQPELLPLLEGATTFDVVLRGYDRHQVHEHLERLEADLRIALAERDATAVRITELAAQIAAAHAEIDALRTQLGHVAEPTLDNMSDRIKHMLSLAQQEAAEIRGAAQREAEETRARHDQLDGEVQLRLSQAEKQAASMLAEAEQRAEATPADAERMAATRLTDAEQRATALLGEAEHKAGTMVTEAERKLAEATQRATELTDEAERQRTAADARAEAKRHEATEDFEIALRARRTQEAKVDAERLAAGEQELAERQRALGRIGEEHMSAARAEADKLLSEARRRVEELGVLRSTVLHQLSAVRSILERVPSAAGATDQEWPHP